MHRQTFNIMKVVDRALSDIEQAKKRDALHRKGKFKVYCIKICEYNERLMRAVNSKSLIL